MSVPISSAAAAPMARPMAQPSRVSPTADHRTDCVRRSQSAVAVWDIDGNSSARITPAALSPCQRPSAAARTTSRSPYVNELRRNTLRVPDHGRGRRLRGDLAVLLHVALDLRDGRGVQRRIKVSGQGLLGGDRGGQAEALDEGLLDGGLVGLGVGD